MCIRNNYICTLNFFLHQNNFVFSEPLEISLDLCVQPTWVHAYKRRFKILRPATSDLWTAVVKHVCCLCSSSAVSASCHYNGFMQSRNVGRQGFASCGCGAFGHNDIWDNCGLNTTSSKPRVFISVGKNDFLRLQVLQLVVKSNSGPK